MARSVATCLRTLTAQLDALDRFLETYRTPEEISAAHAQLAEMERKVALMEERVAERERLVALRALDF